MSVAEPCPSVNLRRRDCGDVCGLPHGTTKTIWLARMNRAVSTHPDFEYCGLLPRYCRVPVRVTIYIDRQPTVIGKLTSWLCHGFSQDTCGFPLYWSMLILGTMLSGFEHDLGSSGTPRVWCGSLPSGRSYHALSRSRNRSSAAGCASSKQQNVQGQSHGTSRG
jgi:hypothetical protein